MRLWHKTIFRGRDWFDRLTVQPFRRVKWKLSGAEIKKGTRIPRMWANWPHQLRIGENCVLEPGIRFKFDGPWAPGPSIDVGNKTFLGNNVEFNAQGKVTIGERCLVGAGCRFIDHDHGIEANAPMGDQSCDISPIQLEDEVWLGANVIVLKGVTIGKGAVIGAGAVVRENVPEGEIWAGVPARKIGSR